MATDAASVGGGRVEDPVLETRSLTRRFGEFTAVDRVDLAVGRGEFRSVIGPNGAGKTTLFNLISGRLRPTEGRVVFDGEDVTRLAPHERVHRGMARSFQITNLFGGLTVRENVRLAVQARAVGDIGPVRSFTRPASAFPALHERTRDVLEQIGLEAHADETARTLAYGDQRRLEIGLVLATDPELVLLDEPTAGMSGEETAATMALVTEVLADKTLVLVEHDIDLVMNFSDAITVLHQGRVIAEGTPAEISANEAVQRAYLGGHG